MVDWVKPDIKHDKKDKDFNTWINEKFDKYKPENDTLSVEQKCKENNKCSIDSLFNHQKIVRDYMEKMIVVDDPHIRGVLVYHGLGSGKTCTSISIADIISKLQNIDKKIIFMSPAALDMNFRKELNTSGSKIYISDKTKTVDIIEELPKKNVLSMVHYNSSKIIDILNELSGDEFIIVDEVHNVISMMVNMTKIGVDMYKIFMKNSNLRFLFLSGTPIVNKPYEICTLINILKGYILPDGNIWTDSEPEHLKFTIFPENEDIFKNEYIDSNTNLIKPDKIKEFKNRLLGMISFYDSAGDLLPEKIEHDTVYVKMSNYQFEKYIVQRNKEIEKEKEKENIIVPGDHNTHLGKVRTKNEDSTYKVNTRSLSNFAYPDNVITEDNEKLETKRVYLNEITAKKDKQQQYEILMSMQLEKLDKVKFNNHITEDQNGNISLYKYSSKFKAMLDIILGNNVVKYKQSKTKIKRDTLNKIEQDGYVESDGLNGPILIYSNYKNYEGIKMFGKVLNDSGEFKELKIKTKIPKNKTIEELKKDNTVWEPFVKEITQLTARPLLKTKQGKTILKINTESERTKPYNYALWTGDEDLYYREIIKYIYNHNLNKNGDLIKALLITSAGAEGISLKNTRQVHIMEPYWNNIRIEQVIGRAVRICSHEALEKEYQNVHIYKYISVFDDKYTEVISTDEVVKNIAFEKQKRIDQIYKLLKESAYDCEINKKHNIKMNPNLRCYTANVKIQYNEKLDEDIEISIKDRDLMNEYNIFNKVKIPDRECYAYILSAVNKLKVKETIYDKYEKQVKLKKIDKIAYIDDINKTKIGNWVIHHKTGFIVLLSKYDFEKNDFITEDEYMCIGV